MPSPSLHCDQLYFKTGEIGECRRLDLSVPPEIERRDFLQGIAKKLYTHITEAECEYWFCKRFHGTKDTLFRMLEHIDQQARLGDTPLDFSEEGGFAPTQ